MIDLLGAWDLGTLDWHVTVCVDTCRTPRCKKDDVIPHRYLQTLQVPSPHYRWMMYLMYLTQHADFNKAWNG